MCICGLKRTIFRNGTLKSSINTGRYTADYLQCGNLPYLAWKKRMTELGNRLSFNMQELRRRNGGEVKRMKVKCIKRYSDIYLKEIVEKGTVLEVTENRGEHLIGEGVAEAVREAKAAAKGKE